jgi:hypothetical protein
VGRHAGMKYRVLAVAEDELPEGCNQVIVELDEGPPLLLVSGPVAECWNFMRAWEDTQEPAWQPSICLPMSQVG